MRILWLVNILMPELAAAAGLPAAVCGVPPVAAGSLPSGGMSSLMM